MSVCLSDNEGTFYNIDDCGRHGIASNLLENAMKVL